MPGQIRPLVAESPTITTFREIALFRQGRFYNAAHPKKLKAAGTNSPPLIVFGTQLWLERLRHGSFFLTERVRRSAGCTLRCHS
jgi:hypothetical protein